MRVRLFKCSQLATATLAILCCVATQPCMAQGEVTLLDFEAAPNEDPTNDMVPDIDGAPVVVLNGVSGFDFELTDTAGATSGSQSLSISRQPNDAFFGLRFNIIDEGDRDALRASVVNGGSLRFDLTTTDGGFTNDTGFSQISFNLLANGVFGAQTMGGDVSFEALGHLGGEDDPELNGVDLTSTIEIPWTAFLANNDANNQLIEDSEFFAFQFSLLHTQTSSSTIFIDNLRVFDPLLSTALLGDFNDDLTVDAADYVVIRDGGVPDLAAGFEAFIDGFGGSDSAAAATALALPAQAVPEPASAMLLTLSAALFACRRRLA